MIRGQAARAPSIWGRPPGMPRQAQLCGRGRALCFPPGPGPTLPLKVAWDRGWGNRSQTGDCGLAKSPWKPRASTCTQPLTFPAGSFSDHSLPTEPGDIGPHATEQPPWGCLPYAREKKTCAVSFPCLACAPLERKTFLAWYFSSAKGGYQDRCE